MKNFYNYTKILTCYFLFLLWFLLLLPSFGCSSMPDAIQIVTAYQSMGATLEQAKPAILALCSNNTLNEADCTEAKRAYNQAVTIYKTLGDASEFAVTTGEQERVRQLTVQLKTLLMYLNTFLVAQ